MFYTETHRVGNTRVYTHTWGSRGWARNVLTPWGIRTVELTRESDTAFSQPARLTLRHNGKRYNVPGFVTVQTSITTGDAMGLQFHGNTDCVQELPRELQIGRLCPVSTYGELLTRYGVDRIAFGRKGE